MAVKSKIGLIIKHEYLVRVRKKSFWLVGILTPIAIVAVGALIAFLGIVNQKEATTIGIYDQSHRIASQITSDDNLHFLPLDPQVVSLDSAMAIPLHKGVIKAVLVVPADTTADYASIERGMALYYNENVPLSVQRTVGSQVEQLIKDKKIELLGVDPKTLQSASADVSIRLVDVSQDDTRQSDGSIVQNIKLSLAFVLCIMLYMFMVFSGNMVMTSTLEEKTNRIVEVIVSSVRPFELMIGKVISSGLVCITQLAIWVVMLTSLSLAGVASLSAVLADRQAEMTEQMAQTLGASSSEAETALGVAGGASSEMMAEMMDVLSQVNFLGIGLISIVFFILGYLLYASLYAAVGAAVDSAGDAGQFVMPITIPLLVAFYCALLIVDNPDGPVAFWMSMIPLTSPVVMMVRIPFGVPAWEVVLSIVLLLGAFLALTWMAAKIYRIGLLSYGTKPTYKDLWRWIRMN